MFNDPQVWNNDFNIYKAHSGFSIETQYMPNDINMYGAKAQSILEADTLFTSKQVFKFMKSSIDDYHHSLQYI